MSNFVYDNVSLPIKKELDPVPNGADPDFYFGSGDFNATIRPALDDLRSAILSGKLFAFAPQLVAPIVANASPYFLYVRDADKHLIYYLDGVEFDITSGGGLPAAPVYKAELVVVAGAPRWRQVAEVVVVFNGSTAEVAAVWPDFAARPFTISASEPVTDAVDSIGVQVIAASVTSAGCTLQANAPFVGTVTITLREVI